MGDERVLTAVQGDAATGSLAAQLCVSPGHPVLAGHFPGAPLVPGVLLLEAVRSAWQQLVGRPHRIEAIDSVRWQAPLAPGTAASLVATAEPTTTGVRLSGEWSAAGVRVGSFQLVLAPR